MVNIGHACFSFSVEFVIAVIWGDQKNAHLDSGLHEVQTEGQGLPHEHVRVVAVLESPLQLFQLPPREVGPRPTSLGRGAFTVVIARI